MTRNGKIARLPADIRTELNHRSTSQYKSVQVNPTNKKIFSRRRSVKFMPKAITNVIAEVTPISDGAQICFCERLALILTFSPPGRRNRCRSILVVRMRLRPVQRRDFPKGSRRFSLSRASGREFWGEGGLEKEICQNRFAPSSPNRY